MESIINKVKETISLKPNAVIGIDGCCASGKTTLAKELALRFNAQVIHTDDFFLLPDMRTPERLSQPGGNVHYERFKSEVAEGINSGKKFDFKPFCCKTCSFGDGIEIDPSKPIIIEGAYTFHPEIPDIYDYKIFVKADYETRISRILERNGADAVESFISKWIPLEDKYFNEFGIESKCDITFET